MKLLIKLIGRWRIIDEYGTDITVHSYSDAIDWMRFCSSNCYVADRWNGKIVAARWY